MSRSASGATVAAVGIHTWRMNIFFGQALEFLRRDRAGYAAVTWLQCASSCASVRVRGDALCISACFCVYVFALSVQLSCRDSETRGAKRLVVGPSYLFALLFHM